MFHDLDGWSFLTGFACAYLSMIIAGVTILMAVGKTTTKAIRNDFPKPDPILSGSCCYNLSSLLKAHSQARPFPSGIITISTLSRVANIRCFLVKRPSHPTDSTRNF
jgi:hypothetical protein